MVKWPGSRCLLFACFAACPGACLAGCGKPGLSGVYEEKSTGMCRFTFQGDSAFQFDNTLSESLHASAPSSFEQYSGTCKLEGKTLTLVPGNLADHPPQTETERVMIKTITSAALTATLSDDGNSFTYNGMTFVKKQD